MAKEFTSDIVEREKLAYVTHGGPSQTLDLYAPKKAKEVPLIVWIHGGGFFFGSKEGFPADPVPLHLLLEGYAVASINYRLSSEAALNSKTSISRPKRPSPACATNSAKLPTLN